MTTPTPTRINAITYFFMAAFGVGAWGFSLLIPFLIASEKSVQTFLLYMTISNSPPLRRRQ
ncbi:MAG: hypothetical protein PVG59_18100, partial [Desulfobacterales bacterium]